MFDFWIETSPFEPPDADGYSKGIIHRQRDCLSAVGYMFPCFDDRQDYHHIKIGRGAWMKIKKNKPQCPDCNGDTTQEIIR